MLQMELVGGCSLLSSLASNQIGQMDALRTTRGILHGLAHLHSKRILHRDLKPAEHRPSWCRLRKSPTSDPLRCCPRVRQVSLRQSTPPCTSRPRDGRFRLTYSMASDIYQVGMLFYELINGSLESQLRHYLTPAVLRGLRVVGRDCESFDDCDKSQQGDKGISELCLKEGSWPARSRLLDSTTRTSCGAS